MWSPVWGLRHSWTSLAEPHNPQNLYASTILLRPPEASPQSGLQLSYKCDSDIHIYIHFNRSCLANSPNGQQLYANDNMQMYLNRGIVRGLCCGEFFTVGPDNSKNCLFRWLCIIIQPNSRLGQPLLSWHGYINTAANSVWNVLDHGRVMSSYPGETASSGTLM